MTMSKTILFLGSPRKHGYTTTLAREAGRGAEEAGLEVKEYDLNDSGIRGCQGCYHCRETYGCATKDYLAPMYQDIADASAIIVASPIYFYQVMGQTKVWLDRMFPMIDGNFAPRQPGKKTITIFSQHQDNPNMFKSGMDWLNNILKDGFGWNLTASIACCGEPEEGSREYEDVLKLAHAAGGALGKS